MKNLDDILFIIGSVIVCIGIAMYSISIAVIVFGIFILLASRGIYKAGKK
jgi:hypothetical protein